jgi:hypothetical protein
MRAQASGADLVHVRDPSRGREELAMVPTTPMLPAFICAFITYVLNATVIKCSIHYSPLWILLFITLCSNTLLALLALAN